MRDLSPERSRASLYLLIIYLLTLRRFDYIVVGDVRARVRVRALKSSNAIKGTMQSDESTNHKLYVAKLFINRLD